MRKEELNQLCIIIKERVQAQEYMIAEKEIDDVMGRYPHSPIPHNLMGILLEAQHSHTLAMKHFRAAYALDPTYAPAQYNLDRCCAFYQEGIIAYEEQDCPRHKQLESPIQVEVLFA
ncbi:MAG: hypothetical protein RSA90_01650 [Lachnospiraceae bacterium]